MMLADHTLLFLHIPKTGGTSLRAALAQCFEPSAACLVYPEGEQHISREQFIDLPEDRRAGFRLICGHYKFGFHRHVSDSVRYISMARHPLSRVPSLYYHHFDRPHVPGYHNVAETSIADFALSGLEPSTDNGMTRVISGVWPDFGHCTEDMLKCALDNLRSHFLVVGTVERYPESVALMRKRLGLELPGVKRLNARKSQHDELDPATAKTILDLNEYDVKLFDAVTQALEAAF